MGARGGTRQAGVLRRRAELATGFGVLLVLALLLVLAITGSGRRHSDGYALQARFDHIDGLDVGSDVRLAGVTVGRVSQEGIDPRTFQASVTFTVRDDIHLPVDSSAVITSDGLLGGKYLALSPGGADQVLRPQGVITQTQGSISLEQLLSKFIFSVTDTMTAMRKEKGSANAPAPAPPAAPPAP
jgi:phospholipid/cholesterol/gamma-HCH transport system substrate-binding protein